MIRLKIRMSLRDTLPTLSDFHALGIACAIYSDLLKSIRNPRDITTDDLIISRKLCKDEIAREKEKKKLPYRGMRDIYGEYDD